jgi:hypothetical protein
MIKKKVAESILEDKILIKVGKRTYKCDVCSVEAMIRISAMIPEDVVINPKGNLIDEAFRVAKDCGFLNEIMAVLIIRKTGLFPELRRKWMAKYYPCVKSPSEMFADFKQLIGTEEIPNFFALTTFLLETNILKPTRKVEKTTASGL